MEPARSLSSQPRSCRPCSFPRHNRIRKPIQKLLWLFIATVSGAVIMGMELVAFRLYAPYFGYSIYVWGSMISVVMLSLSVGYVLGGWVADRSSTDAALYTTILLSGFYQLAILFLYRTILRGPWQSGEFTGTTLATLLIFVL